MSIRIRIFLTVMATAVAIVALGIVVGMSFVQQDVEGTIEKDMRVVANISDELITTKINLLKADAATIAETLTNVHKDEYLKVLQETLPHYNDFLGLTLFSKTDIVAAYGKSLPDSSLLEDHTMELAFKGQRVISSTDFSAYGSLIINVLVPAGDDVLAVTVSGFYFRDIVENFRIWETGNIFILDADGNMIANVHKGWVQERWNFIEIAKTDSQYQAIGATCSNMITGTPGVGRFVVDDKEQLCIYQPITGSKVGWTLGVAAPLDESQLGEFLNGVVLIGLVCLLLSLLAALVASFVLSKPYRDMETLTASLQTTNSELAKAKEIAVDSVEAKSNFLASMSHEMRTPLNAIIGLSELALEEDDMGNASRDNVEKVYSSGVTLLTLINDILDISKIESGNFELIPAKYDTPSLINDTTTLNIVRIGSKPIIFELDVDESLPSVLFGDELRLKQIFNNLLSNAFKYTKEGTVTWSISWERDGDDVWLLSSVKDTGVGIRDEDMQKVFAEYSQVDSKSNKKIEGTGLGLTICKNMIELMDGTIAVESKYGFGSKFSVRIKQSFVNDKPIGAAVVNNLKDFNYTNDKRDRSAKLIRAHIPYAKVLIVDDVQTNLDVAKGMMKGYDMQIDCVTSGFEAIELVRERKVEYNAIFMDHMMPEMDGIEATRIIREEIDTDYAKNVPIIALTANAIVGNEDMFLQNGFQAFLPKPIDILLMDNIINAWVRDKELEKTLAIEQQESTCDRKRGKHIQYEKRSNGDRRCGLDRRLDIAGKSIKGLDFNKGLARFGYDEGTYFEILESYAANTPPLLDQIEAVCEETLGDYAIIVHGLKSSSRGIGADVLGSLAEALEKAAKSKTYSFVSVNNDVFIKSARTFLADLTGMLQRFSKKKPKPQKPEPDPSVLANLLKAAESFDVDGVDEALGELRKYSYEHDSELVDWLQTQADAMGFKQIAERLAQQ